MAAVETPRRETSISLRTPLRLGTLLLAIGLPAAQACGDSSGPGGVPTIDPCTYLAPFRIDTAVTGNLSSADCVFGDGSYVDWYRFPSPAAQAVRVTLRAPFNAWLWLYTRAGVVVALDDDGGGAPGTDASFKAIVPAGDFVVGANSHSAGQIGAYTLTATSTPLVASGCETVWLVGPVTFSEQIEPADCPTSPYADLFLLLVRAGRTVTVTVSSLEVSPHVTLYDVATGYPVASSGEASPQPVVTLSYTVPTPGVYLLEATTFEPEAGAYTLTVSDFASASPATASLTPGASPGWTRDHRARFTGW